MTTDKTADNTFRNKSLDPNYSIDSTNPEPPVSDQMFSVHCRVPESANLAELKLYLMSGLEPPSGGLGTQVSLVPATGTAPSDGGVTGGRRAITFANVTAPAANSPFILEIVVDNSLSTRVVLP